MKFHELLAKGTFAVSTEILLPSGKDPSSVAETRSASLDWADMIRVKVAPVDRPGSHLLAACRVLAQRNVALELEIKTHLVNRLEIGRTMIDAGDAGVEHFLIFSQDYRVSGDSMREMLHFHADMGRFFSVADALARGVDTGGQKRATPKQVVVGAGVDTQFGGQPPDLQVRALEKLAEHGVRYFVTKPIFDPDKLASFTDKMSRLNVPVIAEVLVLQSVDEALLWHALSWIDVPPLMMEKLEKAEKSADGAVDLTMEIVSRLKEFCAGVHLLPHGDIGRIARELKPTTA